MRIPALALLCALCACQPLPQPFAEDRPPPGAPILMLKDGAGVFVEPIADTPELAEAVAEALRQAGTPASTTSANRASYHLAGRIEAGQVVWTVRSAEGRELGRFAQPLGGGPQAAAAQATPRILAMVQDEAPVAAALEGPRIVVQPAEGAPGDGSKSLEKAMASALRQAGVDVAQDQQGTFTLVAKVVVARPVEKKQRVKIVWELRRPGGEQVGVINQENEIPAGTLDGAWGDIAYAVATAASDGVVALLEEVKKGTTPG